MMIEQQLTFHNIKRLCRVFRSPTNRLLSLIKKLLRINGGNFKYHFIAGWVAPCNEQDKSDIILRRTERYNCEILQ